MVYGKLNGLKDKESKLKKTEKEPKEKKPVPTMKDQKLPIIIKYRLKKVHNH